MKKTFGNILYNARTERKMTIPELSSAADVSSSAIYQWENDEKSPTLSSLQKLCKALRISIRINENGEVIREDEA